MTTLGELLLGHRSGFWGTEAGMGDVDVRVVRNGDIHSSGQIRWDRLPVRGFARSELRSAQVRAGDLLLTTSGNCGHVALVREDPSGATCATNFVRLLRPNPDLVHSVYLFHFLNRASFRASLDPFIRGTAMKNLSMKGLLEGSHVPLLSLAEQRRVAEVLDRADALRDKRRQVLAVHDGLTRSIFLDMFGHPSAGDRRWPKVALGELARTMSGGTPSRAITANYGGTIPWVKSGELHSGVVAMTEESLTEHGLANSSAKVMPPGTVLVAMYGATAGIIATLGISAATNQAVCSIEVGPSLDGTFLRKALQLLTPKLLLQRVGGAQPNLSQGAIRALMVPLPPLQLQREFAERIRTFEMVREQQIQHDRGLAHLFASLQQRAFNRQL